MEITSQNTAPFYKTVELDAGLMGAMLTIVVLAEQPGTPGTFTATISVDLILRD